MRSVILFALAAVALALPGAYADNLDAKSPADFDYFMFVR